MNLREIREIRERQSLETVGVTVEELNAYFNKGADKILKQIEELRKEKIKIYSRHKNDCYHMGCANV